MKQQLKKGYIVTAVIILSLIFMTYIIRNRPFNEFGTYLESEYPDLNSDGAKRVCDDYQIAIAELFKVTIKDYDQMSLEDTRVMMSLNKKIRILTLARKEVYKDYNVTNLEDRRKIDFFIKKSMAYKVVLVNKYLGASNENRNFIESYFYFNI